MAVTIVSQNGLRCYLFEMYICFHDTLDRCLVND